MAQRIVPHRANDVVGPGGGACRAASRSETEGGPLVLGPQRLRGFVGGRSTRTARCSAAEARAWALRLAASTKAAASGPGRRARPCEQGPSRHTLLGGFSSAAVGRVSAARGACHRPPAHASPGPAGVLPAAARCDSDPWVPPRLHAQLQPSARESPRSAGQPAARRPDRPPRLASGSQPGPRPARRPPAASSTDTRQEGRLDTRLDVVLRHAAHVPDGGQAARRKPTTPSADRLARAPRPRPQDAWALAGAWS